MPTLKRLAAAVEHVVYGVTDAIADRRPEGGSDPAPDPLATPWPLGLTHAPNRRARTVER